MRTASKISLGGCIFCCVTLASKTCKFYSDYQAKGCVCKTLEFYASSGDSSGFAVCSIDIDDASAEYVGIPTVGRDVASSTEHAEHVAGHGGVPSTTHAGVASAANAERRLQASRRFLREVYRSESPV